MPRKLPMATVIERCQRRCDLEGQGVISNPEWRALISEQYGDLYSVVAESGLRYFEMEKTLVSSGAAYLDEPSDHLATVSFSIVVNTTTGEERELCELMPAEQARWQGLSGGDTVGYAFIDSQIRLFPVPPAGQTYKLRYIFQPPDLSAFDDDACVDVVTPDGEAFLIWGVAVKALAKSESDVTLAIRERDEARERLMTWAALREFNKPRRRVVTDDPFEYPYEPGDWRYR